MARFNRIPPFTSRPASAPRFAVAPSVGSRLTSDAIRTTARVNSRRSRPSLEIFEERTMLSTIPTFAVDSSPVGRPPTIQLSPLQNTIVNGQFAAGQQTNAQNQVYLNAGEVYTASVDVQEVVTVTIPGYFTGSSISNSLPNMLSGLSVQSPAGTTVASASTFSGSMSDLITGQPTNDSEVAFRAPVSGDYTFSVSQIPTSPSNLSYIQTSDAYTLTVRPITLDSSTLNPTANPADAAKLDYSGGGFYAFLDPGGDTLSLVGPTGRGFDVKGTFHETVTLVPGTDQTTTTITSSGAFTVESGLGGLTIPALPGLSLQVTTLANGDRGLFGEVNTAQVLFPFQTLVSDLVSPFGSLLGPSLSTVDTSLNQIGANLSTPGISLGIGLGDQVNALIPDAPLNPAIPYLYLDAKAGVSASLGQITVTAGGEAGAVVIDPADPSLFVEVSGIPVLANIEFAISQHGYIPFDPTIAGTYVSGNSLYGDVFAGGTLSIADLTADVIPASVTGSTVINFSPAGGSWTSTLTSEANSVINGTFNAATLSNFEAGINYSFNASISLEEAATVDFPLSGGSFVVNGIAGTVAFASGTINPFANTPIAFLDGSNLEAQGITNLHTGQFVDTITGNVSIAGINIASGSLLFSNNGIFVSGSLSVLGLNAALVGNVQYDGSFAVWGYLSLSDSIDATYDGYGVYGGFNVGLFVSIQSNGTLGISGYGNVYGGVEANYNSIAGFNDTGTFSFTVDVNALSPTTLFDELVAELA